MLPAALPCTTSLEAPGLACRHLLQVTSSGPSLRKAQPATTNSVCPGARRWLLGPILGIDPCWQIFLRRVQLGGIPRQDPTKGWPILPSAYMYPLWEPSRSSNGEDHFGILTRTKLSKQTLRGLSIPQALYFIEERAENARG